MITSFETGAVFTLKDEATAALERIGLKLDAVEKQFKASLGIVDGQFTALAASIDRTGIGMSEAMKKVTGSIGLQFEDLQKVVGASFVNYGNAAAGAADKIMVAMSRVDMQMAATARSMNELATKMEAVSVSSGGLGLAGRAASGRGHSAGGSGVHFGRVGTEVPGGHLSIAGNAGLAMLGVGGAAIYEAAELQDVIAKAGITGQLPMGGDFMNSPAAKSLASLIQRGAATTGSSIKDTGEAFLGIERMLGGVDFDTRMSVMDTIMPYAGLESRMKEGTSLKDSFESFVGLAHMTGEYDPAKLRDLAKTFAFTSINTSASLPQFEKTLSYSMPMLHNALGMDANTIMLLTAQAQNAGITSTKSGTWIRSFFEGSEPSLGDSDTAQKHNAALKRLGLLDAQNHVNWRKTDAQGKIDWTGSVVNMAGIVASHLKDLPIDERLGVLKQAWGERGGGFGALMGLNTFVEQLPIFAEKAKNFTGADKALGEYAENSVIQQARQVWSDTLNILADLGKTALPQVNKELKGLDDLLKSLSSGHWWDAVRKLDQGAGDTMGKAATAANKAIQDALPRIPDVHQQFQQERRNINPLFKQNAFVTLGGAENDALRALICGGFLDAFREIQGGGANDNLGLGNSPAAGIVQAAYTTWGAGGSGAEAAGLNGSHAILSGGGATANFMRGQFGPAGSNLTTVTTPSGRKVTVHAAAAAAFSGFLGDLEHSGYHINSLGGFNMRSIRGHPGMLSQHAYGNAIDINPGSNPWHSSKTDLPPNVAEMAGKWGLTWGGNWSPRNRDPMHFEWTGRSSSTRVVPPPPRRAPDHAPVNVHMDGKIVAQLVSRRQGVSGRFPTAVGGADHHGIFTSPGSPYSDVA